MDGEGDRLPAPGVRLKDTVRIALVGSATTEQRERFSRVFVKMSILKHLFNVGLEDIFCFQNFTLCGWADVTFQDLRTCQRVAEEWDRLKDHQLLGGPQLYPLYMQDRLPLVVHMYSPHVPDGDVGVFLARHCATVRGGTRLLDEEGTWTGKRRYQVTLRPKPGCPGEYLHPPESFAIGANRGFLWYPGQPRVCRRCGLSGHTKAACGRERCRFCGSEEHSSSRCGVPKACSLCGSAAHLYRACPRRETTYASVAAAGGEEIVDAEDLELEMEAGGGDASASRLLTMRPKQDGGTDLRPLQGDLLVQEAVVEASVGGETDVQERGEWGESEDGAAEVSERFLSGRGAAVEVADARAAADLPPSSPAGGEDREDIEMGEPRWAVKRPAAMMEQEMVAAKSRGLQAG